MGGTLIDWSLSDLMQAIKVLPRCPRLTPNLLMKRWWKSIDWSEAYDGRSINV